ncbi:MAG: glycerol-3-phosphate 1-O-acyltransferase PlsY [Desulfuromonadales bacterium]|nr:glycerol-3-phosphate 1-O-acyltransferase PlsY [Desulfuromonadales bacterium]
MELIITLLLAYLIGAIPCGVVLVKLVGGEDVRKAGSGNIGATNVYRVAGRKLGTMTFLGDALKGAIPIAYAIYLAGMPNEQIAMVAVATFLGHLYPVYIGFKGGKGVATACGIYLMISPATAIIGLIIFALIIWRTRYVSLASICAAIFIPLINYGIDRDPSLLLASLFLSGMVVFRHRENIKRLKNGTESKFKV